MRRACVLGLQPQKDAASAACARSPSLSDKRNCSGTRASGQAGRTTTRPPTRPACLPTMPTSLPDHPPNPLQGSSWKVVVTGFAGYVRRLRIGCRPWRAHKTGLCKVRQASSVRP
jgi:hypothetical protein